MHIITITSDTTGTFYFSDSQGANRPIPLHTITTLAGACRHVHDTFTPDSIVIGACRHLEPAS